MLLSTLSRSVCLVFALWFASASPAWSARRAVKTGRQTGTAQRQPRAVRPRQIAIRPRAERTTKHKAPWKKRGLRTLLRNRNARARKSHLVEPGGGGEITFSLENEFIMHTVKGYGEVMRPAHMSEKQWLAMTRRAREQYVQEHPQGRYAVMDKYRELIANEGVTGLNDAFEYQEFKTRGPKLRSMEEQFRWLDFENRLGLNGSRHGWVVCNNCPNLIRENADGIVGYLHFASDLAEFETLTRGHLRAQKDPNFLPGPNFFHDYNTPVYDYIGQTVAQELRHFEQHGGWRAPKHKNTRTYIGGTYNTKHVYGTAIRRLGKTDLAFEIRSANRKVDSLKRATRTLVHAMQNGFSRFAPFREGAIQWSVVHVAGLTAKQQQRIRRLAYDSPGFNYGSMLSFAFRDWANHPVITQLSGSKKSAAIKRIEKATKKLAQRIVRHKGSKAEFVRKAVAEWAHETQLLKRYVEALPEGVRQTYQREVIAKTKWGR